jgi:acyl-CoA synthetase (AMP-forming)/AMP-acid ligase II
MSGILRAGYTVFPISPRNNPQAIAHLLKLTGAARLFVGRDDILQDLASAAINLLQTTEESYAVAIYDIPVFEDLFRSDSGEPPFMPFPPRRFDMNAPAVILHSSGKWCG